LVFDIVFAPQKQDNIVVLQLIVDMAEFAGTAEILDPFLVIQSEKALLPGHGRR
jgi:hypothetical protein